MTVIAIVAASLNNVIGIDGKLPWNSPSDLALFQKETMGHAVLMGRKTWDSLPRSGVPGVRLPGRETHVLTKNRAFLEKCNPRLTGCTGIWTSLKAAVPELVKRKDKQLFIIGGAEIFKQAIELDLIDEVWLTRMQVTIIKTQGAVYFPQEMLTGWPLWAEPTVFADVGPNYVFERYKNPNRIKKEEPEMIDAAEDVKASARMQRLLAMVVDAYNSNGTICYDLASMCAEELGLEVAERQPQTGEAEGPSPLAAEVADAVGQQLKATMFGGGGVFKIESLTIHVGK